ncbi:hypothetical protein HOK51_11065 [Candidatus Woesearchaeota archaeon]|nr:hypothetical protein [Candidatus Woesearchaeota archaeon]MBT6520362.1 hypothetical protein [Candidatus Woesearchaeota archaeon]MBT7368556.1 hypothetical protein [Candidatus Woesearchaeota archaeon]
MLEIRTELSDRGIVNYVLDPRELTNEWQDQLIDNLYDVAVDSFGRWLPYEAIDSRTRASDSLILLAKKTESGEKIVGYSVNEIINLNCQDINYYNTVLIRRELQEKGIANLLLEMQLMLNPCEVLLSRTQNPAFYRVMKKMCDKYSYELMPGAKIVGNEDDQDRALKIARSYDSNVCPNLIVKGVYFGRALMYDTPEPDTDSITESLIWNRLDVDSGDATMLVAIKK